MTSELDRLMLAEEHSSPRENVWMGSNRKNLRIKEKKHGRPLNFACFRIQRAKAGSKLVVFAAFGLSAAAASALSATTDALPIWLKLNLKEGEEEARPRRRPFVTVGRTLFYIRVLYNAAED